MVTSDPRPLIRTQISDVTRKGSSLTATTTTNTLVLTLLTNAYLCVHWTTRVYRERGQPVSKFFVQDIYSKIDRIEKLSDLQQLSCDATSLATSTPAKAAAAQQRRSRGTMNRRGHRRNKWRSIFDDPPSHVQERAE